MSKPDGQGEGHSSLFYVMLVLGFLVVAAGAGNRGGG